MDGKYRKDKKPLFTLSISNYALIFLFIVATFFIGIGVYAYISLEGARSNIHQNNSLAATAELDQAVSNLLNTVRLVTNEISNWDEVFQQLDNPAYYSYWRKYRLLNADVIPDFINAAEIFDRHGKALAILPDSEFAPHIDVQSLTPLLDLEGQTISLLVYLPIQRSVADESIEGYLGLRLPFIKTLTSQYRFRYIDIDTLVKSSTVNTQIPLSESASVLSFELQSSPEAETMMEIVKLTVIQLASIVGFLCLMFYFLMVYLLGKPLLEI